MIQEIVGHVSQKPCFNDGIKQCVVADMLGEVLEEKAKFDKIDIIVKFLHAPDDQNMESRVVYHVERLVGSVRLDDCEEQLGQH